MVISDNFCRNCCVIRIDSGERIFLEWRRSPVMIIMRLGISVFISFIFWNSFWNISVYSFWRLYNLMWMSEMWIIWDIVAFVCLIIISVIVFFGASSD